MLLVRFLGIVCVYGSLTGTNAIIKIMKIKYDDSFSNEKEIKKNYGDVWKKIIRLIDDIKLAQNVEELRKKEIILKN